MVENAEKQADFGWRYFHFIDPSGTRINVVEHDTDIFGLNKTPYMTMIAKESNQEPARFKGEPNVTYERNIDTKTGNFEFVFKNGRFRGEITDILEHQELADVVLYEDGAGRKSHWAVDVPYGKISGELKTPSGERQIAGYMYQDRQWGNILIQEWVKNWTWTHLANKDLFVVIFCINTQDNQKSWHSIAGQGQSISLARDFEVPHLAELTASGNPNKDTFQAQIQIPGKVSAAFTLSQQNVMRSRMQEEHPGFSASYVRWAVDGTTDRSEQEVQGVAEYMHIQKI